LTLSIFPHKRFTYKGLVKIVRHNRYPPMKPDSLFYRIFKFDPGSLLRLIRLDVGGDYTFESITTKTTEKRFDGYLKPHGDNDPEIFLEVQGYGDNKFYWRMFREICSFYEQNESNSHFIAVALFTNKKFDPGDCPLDCNPPNRLIRAYLPDCLKLLKGNAGVLTVLKPLALARKAELAANLPKWKQDIKSLDLSKSESKTVLELLEYAILQRFKNITLEEVRKMIELTPLEETVAGKELIQLGIEQGIDKGELIGKILLAQMVLKRKTYSKKKLGQKSLGELRVIFKELEKDLKTLAVGS